jgi:hypothetical protein
VSEIVAKMLKRLREAYTNKEDIKIILKHRKQRPELFEDPAEDNSIPRDPKETKAGFMGKCLNRSESATKIGTLLS